MPLTEHDVDTSDLETELRTELGKRCHPSAVAQLLDPALCQLSGAPLPRSEPPAKTNPDALPEAVVRRRWTRSNRSVVVLKENGDLLERVNPLARYRLVRTGATLEDAAQFAGV